MAGIYIHIPFCRKACHYCNFHFTTSRNYQDRMVEAILSEIKERADYLGDTSIQSIYFGGGTPSLLTGEQIDSIFKVIDENWKILSDAEITLEANPDDLSIEFLSMLRNTPVNRLSIGIQSFHDKELEWMNRAHNAAQALGAIALAKSYGFEKLTADLIYGLPGQTMKDWEENIQTMLGTGIGHISAYALTVEPRTALGNWVKKGKVVIPADDQVREQFDLLIDELIAAGLDQYEISNFARTGEEAVHNANYWRGLPYLGIGPSAHSYNVEEREWNEAHNIHYMEGIERGERPFEKEVLSVQDKYNELVMTRLRTRWGVKKLELLALGEQWLEHFLEHAPAAEEKGWINRGHDTFTLTPEGKHWADQVAATFFAE